MRRQDRISVPAQRTGRNDRKDLWESYVRPSFLSGFFPGTHFAQEKSAHHFHYVCVNGNSNTSFYTMRVIASPTTTFCLVKPVSVPGVRPETTLNNYIPPSLKRLLERFTICIRLCDEDVRTITGGTQ